jgi:hypothetical protein
VTWTLETAYPRMVERLTQLAMQPAWRDQVGHMISELEADQSGYWDGIRQAVNESVKAAKAAKAGQAKAPGSEPLQPVKSL